MAHPLLSDPFVAAEVEAAIEPYVDILSEEELAFMRDELALLLAEDPEAQDALDGARPREVDRSGTRPKLAESTEVAVAATGTTDDRSE